MKTWVIVIHQMVKNLKSKPKNDELILTKDQLWILQMKHKHYS